MGRLPAKANADRSTQFIEQLKAHHPDVVMMNDLGVDWRNMPIQDRWNERAAAGGSQDTGQDSL